MTDPDWNISGVDDGLDDVNSRRRAFSPAHCEVCGNKADKYLNTGTFMACESCVRSWERDRMKRNFTKAY